MPIVVLAERADEHEAVTIVKAGAQDYLVRSELSPALQRKVDERLSWQRPKAIVTGLLFVLFAIACIRFWNRPLVRTVGLACTLVLLIMAMANTETSKGNARGACMHYMRAQKMGMMKSDGMNNGMKM